MDHKTYEARANYNDLANNDQFLAYTWAAAQVFGKPIAGYMYNGMWKREQPPRNKTMDDLFMIKS